jgi:hypothetical protein
MATDVDGCASWPKVKTLSILCAIEAWLAPDVRRRLCRPEGDPISGAIILERQEN